jgi:predicted  nucleic acid-binding Zn-ribbon protein
MATKKRNGRKGSPDEQVEVLRLIWNEMKALNSGVDQTNERLDKTNERLDAVRVELKDELDALRRRVVESEVRLATVTTQLSSDVQDLSGVIREWREEHRADRADFRARLLRLERHAGLEPAG